MDSLSMYDLKCDYSMCCPWIPGDPGNLATTCLLVWTESTPGETPETMMSKELWMFVGSATTSGVRDGVNLHSDRWTGSTPHGKPANYASQATALFFRIESVIWAPTGK